MSVKKAVIPAAGFGTRFLPATKAIPKEMIPVVDRPGIQYVVEEAAGAGIEEILIVTSRGKQAMEDHFDRAVELETYLEKKGKLDELEEVRRIANIARIHSVRQKEALGLGHAISMGRVFAGDDPFAVLYPDELLPGSNHGGADVLSQMIELYDETGSSVILVQDVSAEEISAYGAIEPEEVDGRIRVKKMVEKPAPEDAPSTLASRGRHVFSPSIFAALDLTEAGVGGEIQLADAIDLLAREETVYAHVYSGPVFDVGRKLDYLKATVQLALLRDDLADGFRDFLVELLDQDRS